VLKIVAAGLTALFVTAAPLAYAEQAASQDHLTAADYEHLAERELRSLAQRSADLKRLADAWQPLYQTLDPDQKRRMAFLALFALRELRDVAEERRVRSDDDSDDE
jgi:hypothetical protein